MLAAWGQIKICVLGGLVGVLLEFCVVEGVFEINGPAVVEGPGDGGV
jgi:hypothetical protein